MDKYFFANQIYQFSYAKPLYDRIGGTFIVRKTKKIITFKKRLRNANAFPEIQKTFLNTPPIKKMDIKNIHHLKGVIVSLSNTKMHVDSKLCKSIFIGHGTGDKKYGGNSSTQDTYDYHFISGPKHLQKQKDVGLNIAEGKLIKIGNMRFDNYVNNKIDKEKVFKHLGIKDRSRKNILYAPTWRWGNGTFKHYVYKFCKELSKDFNLIVRPHHHDAQKIILVKSWCKLHGIKNVYFSNPGKLLTNDTMSDFSISDLMISDTSSVMYEYLITKKPIIVAIHKLPELHNMPDNMNVMKHTPIYNGSQNIAQMVKQSLENSDNEKIFGELLNNCFYFNDGKSVDRAVQFINSLQN